MFLHIGPDILLMNKLAWLSQLLNHIEYGVLYIRGDTHLQVLSSRLLLMSITCLINDTVHLLTLEVFILYWSEIISEELTVSTPFVLTMWATQVWRRWLVTSSNLVIGRMWVPTITLSSLNTLTFPNTFTYTFSLSHKRLTKSSKIANFIINLIIF